MESFASLLYETIAQNKLSGSRVARVTDSATQALSDPEMLAKTMLKAHLRASPANKLVSLYLFDAVARHAQEIARRQGAGFDSDDSPQTLAANASSFLRALHEPAAQVGVDCMQHVPPEQRDKVRKVIDIWGRAGTFHAKILQRIQEEGSSTSSASSASAPPPGPAPRRPPPRTTAAPTQPASAGLPASVLALLSPPGAGSTASMPSMTAAPSAPDVPASVSAMLSPPPTSGSGASSMPYSAAPAPSTTARAPSTEPAPIKEDLSAFDQASFDPTNSAHWERLSQLWKNTYQYEPTGPELMMALMSGMLSKEQDPRWGGMNGMPPMMPGMPGMPPMPPMPPMPGMPDLASMMSPRPS
ncbi:hypothetical protein ACI68E_001389 [Malassezia pachydermatis]